MNYDCNATLFLKKKIYELRIISYLCNQNDNRIENLEITTRSTHQQILHREDLENRRDKTTGRFTSGLRDSLNKQKKKLFEI